MTAPSPAKVRSPARRLLTIHRWVSIGAAVFWLLQAITGVLIVFHWEIVDRSISDLHRPTDLAAIERRLDHLAGSDDGVAIQSVWTTAGMADRYNINFRNADGQSASMRIAGDGKPLYALGPGDKLFMRHLVDFHHDLLGAWGSWIVSISGILLCSNLLLGLATAWPRRQGWRRALVPVRKGPAPGRLYSWHRAVGLWAVIPALIIVTTGTLLKFEDGVGELVGVEPVSLPANAPQGEPVGFAVAASAALDAIPGSRLTAVSWPKPDDATYNIRVLAPGEMRRAYGASVVLVDANNGAVRGVYPIADAEPARAFMMSLFPIHTGEAAGIMGRLLQIAIGLWLITMIVVGLLLWWKRRRPAARQG